MLYAENSTAAAMTPMNTMPANGWNPPSRSGPLLLAGSIEPGSAKSLMEISPVCWGSRLRIAHDSRMTICLRRKNSKSRALFGEPLRAVIVPIGNLQYGGYEDAPDFPAFI